MPAINREESLEFWQEQRIALLQYIEAARSSGGSNEQSYARLKALNAGITRIDARIGQLRSSTARGQVVLVVDDNPEIVHLLCLFLRGAGLTCLAAVGSAEAISLWKEHQETISLVVTDVQMPEMNGDELVERFLKEKPAVKVVFTSGTPWASRTPLEEGVNFFVKPFHPKEVAKRIKEMLIEESPNCGSGGS